MATIVNNPAPSGDSGGTGMLIGVILLIVFVVLLLYFGLPVIRRATQAPAAPEINVPEQIDINVQTPAE